MGHSCSNPVHIDHKGTHAGVNQWPVSIIAKGQINEACFLRNVESWKSGSFPGTSNRVSGRVFVADAAVWQASAKPLMAINAVDLDMSCFLPSSCPMWQQFANKCSDTGVSRLPSQMSAAVALAKFLSDWCKGLIHPSSFASFLFYLPLLEDWTFSPAEGLSRSSSLATLPLSILLEEQTLAPEFNVLLEHLWSNSDHINRQYWRKGTNVGANQWPLWEKRSLRSFHHGHRSDQWRVSPSKCWKLRKLEFGRHLKRCGKKSLGVWCFRVTTHFGWGSGSWQEWAQHCQDFATEVWHCPEFQIVVKHQEAFLLQASEWKLLGSNWELQRPFGRCCTAKRKQHLRHKQGMMIQAEWHQWSLSHGAILQWPGSL